MSTTLRIILAILLVGASCLAGAAAHAPTLADVPAEPIPSRSLYIIAQDPEAYHQNSSYPDNQDEFHLALSSNTTDTVEERRHYSRSDYHVGPYCTSWFCSPNYGGKGLLENVGEDFRLAPTQDIAGVIDLDFYYSDMSPVGNADAAGRLYLGMGIGTGYYEAEPIELDGYDQYEPALYNVTLHFISGCDVESRDENGEPRCDESFDNWTEEVWTHDVLMWIYVELPDRGIVSLGRHFDMGIGTNGTSKVDLPIYVPPAPAKIAAEDDSMVTIAHDELDAEGNVAEPVAVGEDLYYVPGLTLPLVLVGTAMLAVLIRRRV